MLKHKGHIFFWFTILAIIMACVPAFPAATPFPTIDPGAVNTFIVQTANAASTQTAAHLPTSTPTETSTPTPRNTNTPEPTATNTVIFRLSTATPYIAPTFTGISDNGRSNKYYACIPMSVDPPNGTVFAPRFQFEAKWVVKNNGAKEWDKKIVGYQYDNGDKFHIISSYQLSKSVPIGVKTTITASMEAPKNPGIYTTNWIFTNDTGKFCKFNLTIVVQDNTTPTVEETVTP